MKNIKISSIIILFIFFNACRSDDDTGTGTGITPNEEELITQVNLIFSDTLGQVIDTVSFNDPDGDGGNDPVIDTIYFSKSTTYNLAIEFKDASDPNDVEDITAEIEAEDDEHIICFEQTGIVGLGIRRTDTDGTYEVGLKSEWVSVDTLSSNNGKVRLILKHQPDLKDGTCTPGSTDAEIDFPFIVK